MMAARLLVLLALLVAPLATEALQPGKVYRVGYLSSARNISEPFREASRELGYVNGQNLVIESRLAAGRLDQLPSLAANLIRARRLDRGREPPGQSGGERGNHDDLYRYGVQLDRLRP